jgi:hypothetical protein
MLEFFWHLSAADFMAMVGKHAISDGLIALAYLLIPAALILQARHRRNLPFRWVRIHNIAAAFL